MRQSIAFLTLILVSFHDSRFTAHASDTEAKIGALYLEDIMQDVLEIPRFKIDFIHEPLAESKLSETVAMLNKRAQRMAKEQGPVKENSGYPNVSSLIYDPLVVSAGRLSKFLCQVPRVDNNDEAVYSTENEEHRQKSGNSQEGLDSNGLEKELRITVERGLELLDSLKTECILFTAGWWTYEYCHGKYVRQFHKFEPDSDGIVFSVEYMLGKHDHIRPFPVLSDGSFSKNSNNNRKDKTEMRDTQVSRIGRKRFLTQVWGGGTECDLTGKPRQIEVQFHCDPNGPERIVMVEEAMTCYYVMVINTPRLCADPRFYDMLASTAYSIKCQQVIADALIRPLTEEQGEFANKHIGESALDEESTEEDPEKQRTRYLPEQPGIVAAREMNEKASMGTINGDEEKGTLNREKAQPQVVLSVKDPRLMREHKSKEQQEMIRRVLAIMYGDEDLNVGFANADADADADEEQARAESLVQGQDDGKHTDAKGGGGDGANGNGKWGDRPPMTSELFPDRSGFKSKAKVKGDGDSSKPFTPLPYFAANAQFPTVKRYQTVEPRRFSKHSPAIYYASTTRDEYPGAWGHGFYLLYPYPWWAYGVGNKLGPTFYCNRTESSFNVYKPQLRNMTVLNDTNIPLVGNYDVFKNGKYAGFTDYNNGTLEIKPCADLNNSELGVSDKDCESIVLDIVQGSVVSGNAETDIQNEFTLFKLKLGQKEAVLRTVTISSTTKKLSGGGIAG
ncbi:Protein OS-9, partial [Coemansia erecta]